MCESTCSATILSKEPLISCSMLLSGDSIPAAVDTLGTRVAVGVTAADVAREKVALDCVALRRPGTSPLLPTASRCSISAFHQAYKPICKGFLKWPDEFLQRYSKQDSVSAYLSKAGALETVQLRGLTISQAGSPSSAQTLGTEAGPADSWDVAEQHLHGWPRPELLPGLLRLLSGMRSQPWAQLACCLIEDLHSAASMSVLGPSQGSSLCVSCWDPAAVAVCLARHPLEKG